jgi:Neutral/alkaline non-lysosomal ceramidase, N-terminal
MVLRRLLFATCRTVFSILECALVYDRQLEGYDVKCKSIACCVVLFASFLAGNDRAIAQEYKVGVARMDITPAEPIWLSGYGSRNKPSDGIDSKLFAKALATEDSNGNRSVLVTVELIGFPAEFAEKISDTIKASHGISRDRFMLVASHTHTGPVIYNSLGGMFDLKGRDAATVESYTKLLGEQLTKLVGQSLNKLQPAKLSFGHGQAKFAANRRVFRPSGVQFGVNPDGQVDHDVPVLRVQSANDEPLAILFGYACHCTTLGGDHYRVGGDWAGYAQEYLEAAHPGAIAMFVTGCGADANPEPRGKLEFARQHGLNMAGTVAAVLTRPMTGVSGPIGAAFDRVELPLADPPSREEFAKRLTDKSEFVRRHAQAQIDLLDRNKPLRKSYPCPVQVWRFGDDLTMVAIGGEVVVDYVLRLKREIGAEKLWVAGYANDVFAYVPSVRILTEGGYEADFNLIYYGLPSRFAPAVEETLVRSVHEIVRRAKQ